MFEKIYKLKEGLRWVRDKLTQGTLILLYHRVVDLPSDPQLLCVSPKHFDEQMEVLNKFYRPIHLNELINNFGKNKTLPKTVVVTFDDGYSDNALHAKPIMSKYNVPGTVFVTGNYIGTHQEFWWDELERIFLHPGTLPASLSLEISGKEYSWSLNGGSRYIEKEYQKHLTWNVLKSEDPTIRHRIYRVVCKNLRFLGGEERKKILDLLVNWAGLHPSGRPTHRILSQKELVQMGKDGLLELGAHSMTHSPLSALPEAFQSKEIFESKKILEDAIGKPVTSFAYPFGSRGDYTKETISLVKKSSFRCACSNFEGIVSPKTDLFQLPRFLIRNWSGEEFSKQIRNLMG